MIKTAILLLLTLAVSASAAELDIEVRGTTGKGPIHVALYDGKATFLSKPLRTLTVPADQVPAVARFGDVPPGRYALTLFQDENGNGKLDRNLLGIPSEPYGFSNDAKGKFGPPSFEAASIDLPAEGKRLVASVHR